MVNGHAGAVVTPQLSGDARSRASSPGSVGAARQPEVKAVAAYRRRAVRRSSGASRRRHAAAEGGMGAGPPPARGSSSRTTKPGRRSRERHQARMANYGSDALPPSGRLPRRRGPARCSSARERESASAQKGADGGSLDLGNGPRRHAARLRAIPAARSSFVRPVRRSARKKVRPRNHPQGPTSR